MRVWIDEVKFLDDVDETVVFLGKFVGLMGWQEKQKSRQAMLSKPPQQWRRAAAAELSPRVVMELMRPSDIRLPALLNHDSTDKRVRL